MREGRFVRPVTAARVIELYAQPTRALGQWRCTSLKHTSLSDPLASPDGVTVGVAYVIAVTFALWWL